MDNSKKIILDLCGGTGSWSKPYKDAGYDVRVITLPDYDIEKWRTYPELVELIESNKIYGILAAPPCTMFSIARNGVCKEPRDLRKGMKTVMACLEIIWECRFMPITNSQNNLKFWVLENPRGYLDQFLGKPVFEFDPYEFGDPYTKRTYLWGNFNIPAKSPVQPQRFSRGVDFVSAPEDFYHLKEHQIPEGYQQRTGLAKRVIVRSITPQGFAQAFYRSNK